MKRYGAFLAHDVLGGAQLKDCASQIAVLENRAHDGVAVGILLILKTNELQAGLFQQHIAAHRRVGHVHRDGRRFGSRKSGCCREGQQQKHGRAQMEQSFHESHHHCVSSYHRMVAVVVYPASR